MINLKKMRMLLGMYFLLAMPFCKDHQPTKVTQLNGSDTLSLQARLVNNYFPIRELPLEVSPNDIVPQSQIIRGKDKAVLFPNAKDGDIVAIARLQLFDHKTTIIFREDWLYEDTYIVTFDAGKFDLSGAKSIASTWVTEENDGYIAANIGIDGSITRRSTTDATNFEILGVVKYTAANQLLPLN